MSYLNNKIKYTFVWFNFLLLKTLCTVLSETWFTLPFDLDMRWRSEAKISGLLSGIIYLCISRWHSARVNVLSNTCGRINPLYSSNNRLTRPVFPLDILLAHWWIRAMNLVCIAYGRGCGKHEQILLAEMWDVSIRNFIKIFSATTAFVLEVHHACTGHTC